MARWCERVTTVTEIGEATQPPPLCEDCGKVPYTFIQFGLLLCSQCFVAAMNSWADAVAMAGERIASEVAD